LYPLGWFGQVDVPTVVCFTDMTMLGCLRPFSSVIGLFRNTTSETFRRLDIEGQVHNALVLHVQLGQPNQELELEGSMSFLHLHVSREEHYTYTWRVRIDCSI